MSNTTLIKDLWKADMQTQEHEHAFGTWVGRGDPVDWLLHEVDMEDTDGVIPKPRL